ncbi:MAG: TetR/AcrR family transcriptional regulator, partial [Acutalibacteraceae bacterium]
MKQEERTKQSVEEIINAAVEEFAAKGYENAVVNNICRNNGISKGKLFHHFKGKDDLFLACCKYTGELFAEHNRRFTPSASKSFQENLHDYFDHRNIFYLRKKGSIDILWMINKNEIPKFRSEIGELYENLKESNIENLRKIFAQSNSSPDFKYFESVSRAFYIAQSYVSMNCLVNNSVYLLSEAKQRQMYNENTVIMDSIMDILLFGIYPRDKNCPERMPIDREEEN